MSEWQLIAAWCLSGIFINSLLGMLNYVITKEKSNIEYVLIMGAILGPLNFVLFVILATFSLFLGDRDKY